jgi:hypothetical protein
MKEKNKTKQLLFVLIFTKGVKRKMNESKKEIVAQVSKTERKIAKDGSGYTEKSLIVQGKELKEVKETFDKEWKDE